MGEVLPVPSFGELFTDQRGGGRTMRVSYHDDRDTVVVSLWFGTTCRGSFRLDAGELPKLIDALQGFHGRDDPDDGAAEPVSPMSPPPPPPTSAAA